MALLCTVIFVLNAGEFVIIIVPVHFALIYNSCFFFLYYNPLSKVRLFLSVSVSSKFELFEDIFHTKLSQRSKVKAVIA